MKHVYDMSFAEFQIRLFAYKRVQEREWEKTRYIAFHAMIGSHSDPKRLPKSLHQFMPLNIDGKQKININDRQKEAFLEATKQYLIQAENGRT